MENIKRDYSLKLLISFKGVVVVVVSFIAVVVVCLKLFCWFIFVVLLFTLFYSVLLLCCFLYFCRASSCLCFFFLYRLKISEAKIFDISVFFNSVAGPLTTQSTLLKNISFLVVFVMKKIPSPTYQK